jgi:hypothetical protein
MLIPFAVAGRGIGVPSIEVDLDSALRWGVNGGTGGMAEDGREGGLRLVFDPEDVVARLRECELSRRLFGASLILGCV